MTRLAQIFLSLMMMLGFFSPAAFSSVRPHAMQPECGMACCQQPEPVSTCCKGEEKEAPKPAPEKEDCPCFAPGGETLPAALAAPSLNLLVPAILAKPEAWTPARSERPSVTVPVLTQGHPIRGPTDPLNSRAPPVV